MRIKDIDLSDYNYDLPDEKIAQYPVNERDMSKLLISDRSSISHTVFHNIDEHIPAGHLLVFNNTKVVRARIRFQKDTGASVEVFCLEPVKPADYEQSFSARGEVVWKCIIGNLKRWKKDKLIKQFFFNGKSYDLTAEKFSQHGDAWEIVFKWNCPGITFAGVLENTGHIPLPPYINREDRDEDILRYQTIYAQIKGSVAAPTAGLHFTGQVLEKLKRKGVGISEVTLHVGAGTFQPIKTERITEHEMHREHFTITAKAIEQILENEGRIIAVGTTSVRTLESLYWIGIKLLSDSTDNTAELTADQWEPYTCDTTCPTETALKAILDYMGKRGTSYLNASTRIIIIPGYVFRITDGIITNFHQPCSTLLLLVSAWTGSRWKEIYNYALENDFRFLSYGDCSLLLR
jgi:S-adenosylmethionine:tRNA ribosyltransferase-isomerase